jgi:hypothetical protein
LKEAGLSCEGLTTPGGYGGRNQTNLALGTLEAVREVYNAEIPHYFRDVYSEKGKSVAPKVLHPSDLEGPNPKCVVHIIGCTEDWFGDWDGLNPGSPDKFITEDLGSGRMVEVVDSGEPAIMVCHWPGIYFNGEKTGFNILKQIKKRLDQKYQNLVWMKLCEIARYWAAKELTKMEILGNKVVMKAPYSCPGFTIKVSSTKLNPQIKNKNNESKPLLRLKNEKEIRSGTWYSDKTGSVLCFDLEKGLNEIHLLP